MPEELHFWRCWWRCRTFWACLSFQAETLLCQVIPALVKASLWLPSGWLLHKLIFHMQCAATGNGASAIQCSSERRHFEWMEQKPCLRTTFNWSHSTRYVYLVFSACQRWLVMFSDRNQISAVLVFGANFLDPKWSLNSKLSVGTVLKILRAIAEVQNSRDRWCNGLICL